MNGQKNDEKRVAKKFDKKRRKFVESESPSGEAASSGVG
jgi:hypothetical protein